MSTRKKTALAVAHALREEFRARGEFRQSEYRDALGARLEEFRAESFQGLVDGIARQVDEQASRERCEDPDQQTFGWDTEGEYRLGDGRRIAKGLARIEHADEMLAILMQNASRVLQAQAHKLDEISRLRPYWKQGWTKRQAIDAYLGDHPDSEA